MKVSEMDLLDYFALQSLPLFHDKGTYPNADIAKRAYDFAAEMLAERQQRKDRGQI